MKTIIIVFFITVAYIIGMSKFEQYMYLDSLKYNSNYQSYSIINADNDEDIQTVIVSITGEVNSQQKVSISKGSILAEAIEKCGGLKPTADSRCIDLSLVINKSLNLHIPAINLLLNKISLNEASLEELDSLPGIGTTYANRIIEHRSAYGNFQYLEQLMEVNGIGQSTFNKIKDLITL